MIRISLNVYDVKEKNRNDRKYIKQYKIQFHKIQQIAVYIPCAIGPWKPKEETFDYNEGYMPNNCTDIYLDSPEYTEDDINKVLLFRMNDRTSYDVDAENKAEYNIVKIK